MRVIILGIHGQIGNGKDFLVDYLKRKLDFYVFTDRFAKGVKTVVSGICDIPLTDGDFTREQKNTYLPNIGMTVAQCHQALEPLKDIFGADMWVKQVKRRIIDTCEKYQDLLEEDDLMVYIVNDVRLPIEAEMLKGLTKRFLTNFRNITEAKCIIVAKKFESEESITDTRDKNHITEQPLPYTMIDFTISDVEEFDLSLLK